MHQILKATGYRKNHMLLHGNNNCLEQDPLTKALIHQVFYKHN